MSLRWVAADGCVTAKVRVVHTIDGPLLAAVFGALAITTTQDLAQRFPTRAAADEYLKARLAEVGYMGCVDALVFLGQGDIPEMEAHLGLANALRLIEWCWPVAAEQAKAMLKQYSPRPDAPVWAANHPTGVV